MPRFPLSPDVTDRDSHSRLFSAVLAMLVTVILVACVENGNGDDERRFANEPVTVSAQPSHEPTEVAVAPIAPTVASGSNQLSVRGASPIVYVMGHDRVLVVDARLGEMVGEIEVSAGYSLLGLAGSAGGDRVAVLEASFASLLPVARAIVYSRAGERLAMWELPWPPSAGATPRAVDSAALVGTIAWDASGESLLVSLGGESLASLAFDGTVRDIPVPANVRTIVDAEPSPRGNAIAVLDQDSQGNGRIMVLDPVANSGRARQLVPPTADTSAQGNARAFVWSPDGDDIVFLLADEAFRGALYRVPVGGGQRQLIASPGQGGPTAQITDFALSPQGDAIFYAIGEPDGEAIASGSLWVRTLKSAAVTQIPVSLNSPIQGMWWSDSGVVWLQDETVITIARSDGQATVIDLAYPEAEMTSELAGGTPGATPAIASPVSPSPIASPIIATPEATPRH